MIRKDEFSSIFHGNKAGNKVTWNGRRKIYQIHNHAQENLHYFPMMRKRAAAIQLNRTMRLLSILHFHSELHCNCISPTCRLRSLLQSPYACTLYLSKVVVSSHKNIIFMNAPIHFSSSSRISDANKYASYIQCGYLIWMPCIMVCSKDSCKLQYTQSYNVE